MVRMNVMPIMVILIELEEKIKFKKDNMHSNNCENNFHRVLYKMTILEKLIEISTVIGLRIGARVMKISVTLTTQLDSQLDVIDFGVIKTYGIEN